MSSWAGLTARIVSSGGRGAPPGTAADRSRTTPARTTRQQDRDQPRTQREVGKQVHHGPHLFIESARHPPTGATLCGPG